MFEDLVGAELAAAIAAANVQPREGAGGPGTESAPDTGQIEESLGELVDRVTACDRLMGWATAIQSRAVSELRSGFERLHAENLPPAASNEMLEEARVDAVKDCAVELGMARRTGMGAARTLIAFAGHLVTDHPVLLDMMERGRVSAWIARAVLTETDVLPTRLRRDADRQISPLLPGMSWGEATQTARRVVVELDAAAAARRAETARNDRSISVRPRPDGMAGLWADLPAIPHFKRLLAGQDTILRRLVTDPVDDHILCVDSKQRFHRGELRELILTIDPVCIVPGCDRRAIQVDHAKRYADGGTTAAGNGLGECARHNLAREQPRHQLHITDGDGDDPGEILWRTLSRKVYQLLHPPALGPGATTRPDTDIVAEPP